MVRDERTCLQVRDLLARGGAALMRERFFSLLLRNAARSVHVRGAVLARYGWEGQGAAWDGGAAARPANAA